MLDSEILQKVQSASIEERITIIELLLQSLKSELTHNIASVPPVLELEPRPAFGFMKSSGKILGDVVAPILPDTAWEALQ